VANCVLYCPLRFDVAVFCRAASTVYVAVMCLAMNVDMS